MKNITYYKIGMGFYEGKDDKNSGLYEYELIKTELEKIDEKVKFGTLIVLNGKADSGELDLVESMIETCHKFNAKAIYIISDSVAFNNVDFVNKFDAVLHQARGYKFDFIKVKQWYSYVPELFLVNDKQPINTNANNLVLFCGNDTGRCDKIDEYVRGKNGTKKNMFSLIKYANGEDERIPHDSYLKLQKMFKYSLMICREQYRDCCWITARLIEAIDNGSLPIFDREYDKALAYRRTGLVVGNKYELNRLVKYFNKHEDLRLEILSSLRKKIERRRIMFACNIVEMCKE